MPCDYNRLFYQVFLLSSSWHVYCYIKECERTNVIMLRLQRTIKNSITCEGIGLHTGRQAHMTLLPAPVNTGIAFIRTDLGGMKIHASSSNTAGTGHATTLSSNGATVQTVEHLLAALAGLSIDNVFVQIDSDEAPIMDGSAGPFVRMIAEAGVQVQDMPAKALKIIKPIFVREGNKQLAVWPAERPGISYFIDFNHPMLKEQSLNYHPSEDEFMREIADARTFGFLSDEKTLRANGLAMGASLDNAIVLGQDAVLNKGGLRYRDEFVRHKILDLIGDLSLVGMPIIGHIVAHKSGHRLNSQMAARLIENPDHWVVLGAAESPIRPREKESAYQLGAAV